MGKNIASMAWDGIWKECNEKLTINTWLSERDQKSKCYKTITFQTPAIMHLGGNNEDLSIHVICREKFQQKMLIQSLLSDGRKWMLDLKSSAREQNTLEPGGRRQKPI